MKNSKLRQVFNWLGRKTMSKKQLAWLERLSVKDNWERDTSSVMLDHVVDADGNWTYLNQNAVMIMGPDQKTVVTFFPDLFGVRKRACRELVEHLGTDEMKRAYKREQIWLILTIVVSAVLIWLIEMAILWAL